MRMNERLGPSSPVVLYGAGDRELLATDGIGVVGSRNLSPQGEIVARDIAAAAAGADLPVVSGGARGADQIAMSAAMEAGGRAVGVLAHPLTRTMSDSWTASALDDGRLCLVTPFKPDAGFSVGNAMGRNKLIYALSRVTAVVASSHGPAGPGAARTKRSIVSSERSRSGGAPERDPEMRLSRLPPRLSLSPTRPAILELSPVAVPTGEPSLATPSQGDDVVQANRR